MTRPLYVATVAIAALLAFAAFALETATAGGRALIAPPAGVSANARTAVLPGFPDVSGRSVAPRFEARRGFGHGYSPYDYRFLATGDFRYGRLYDAYLTGPYGGGQGGYGQPGPLIITLGAPAVAGSAAAEDALVIAAPPQAAGFQHGVRIISLLDPPAEFQLQRAAPPEHRRRK